MNGQRIVLSPHDHQEIQIITLKEVDQNSEEIGGVSEENSKSSINSLPETYTIIPGVQYKSKIYVDNLGYKYYKRSTHANRVYLVCDRQKKSKSFCRAVGSVSTNENCNTINLRAHHNHEPTEIDWDLSFLREEIATKGINETTSIRTIYNNAIAQ